MKILWLLLFGIGVVFFGLRMAAAARTETAVLAGGCFWCMVAPFEQLPGVTQVRSGYTGGTGADPTYEDYAEKGHLEAVEITFDPAKTKYEDVLEVFWRQIDPTDAGGQFVDRGRHYRSAIFYLNDAQRQAAERSKQALAASGRFQKPIVTEILPGGKFYDAEDYHQNYHQKNALRYNFYRTAAGRDRFLDQVWGKDRSKNLAKGPQIRDPGARPAKKPESGSLKKKLTPLQFQVTQQCGTEPPFQNAYWDNKREGIYVDIVSGEPLFSSLDKFDSGTGWPSFTRPLDDKNLVKKEDRTLFSPRTEVRSAKADSHLGHVFDDGPKPTGQRYCINSAALRFVPKEDLEKEGYGEYQKLFKK